MIEELKVLCYEKLPQYELPIDFQFDREFPLTSIGKIDFQRMEKDDENLGIIYRDDMIQEIYKDAINTEKSKVIGQKK